MSERRVKGIRGYLSAQPLTCCLCGTTAQRWQTSLIDAPAATSVIHYFPLFGLGCERDTLTLLILPALGARLASSGSDQLVNPRLSLSLISYDPGYNHPLFHSFDLLVYGYDV